VSALPNCPACGRACDTDDDGVFCRTPLSECPYDRFFTVDMHRALVDQAAKAAALDRVFQQVGHSDELCPTCKGYEFLAEERAKRGLT